MFSIAGEFEYELLFSIFVLRTRLHVFGCFVTVLMVNAKSVRAIYRLMYDLVTQSAFDESCVYDFET